MEAMVLVNEEVPGPKVTDEEKYEEILNQRKERKAVSHFVVMEEALWFRMLKM